MNNWRTTNEIKKALHKSAAYFQETKIGLKSLDWSKTNEY